MPSEPCTISVIVPIYNNPDDLVQCISALKTSSLTPLEIIVVNDGSTDNTGSIAEGLGVTVVHLTKNVGGASARNYGAQSALGDILFFIDSDVVVPTTTVNNVLQFFIENPSFSAIFGSYDSRPRAESFISLYRNLLHHYVHQCGKPEAVTFWAGCGAVRRSAFEEVGGFNPDFATHLEDVELGYRLKKAGFRIRLEKTLQVNHLKRWTFWSMIKADVISRALPWSRLILEAREFPNDLNVDVTQRMSVMFVMLGIVLLLAGAMWTPLLLIAGGAFSAPIILNRALFMFFYRKRGFMFSCGCVPLHLLYYFYSGSAFLLVWLEKKISRGGKHSTILSVNK